MRCDLPDGVASAQANPLGDRAVLALSLGKLLLGAEGLVALLGKNDGLEIFLSFFDIVWR
jgi:hypothetical protein